MERALAGFQFYDVDVFGIGCDVLGRQFGLVGAVARGDPALFARSRRAWLPLLGSLGMAIQAASGIFDIGVAVGVEGNRCEIRIADGDEVSAAIFR